MRWARTRTVSTTARGMVYGLATESRRLLMGELKFGDQVAEPIPSVVWEGMSSESFNVQA
jgi:hypothetical protein